MIEKVLCFLAGWWLAALLVEQYILLITEPVIVRCDGGLEEAVKP